MVGATVMRRSREGPRFGIDFENPKDDKLDIDPKQGSVLIFLQRDMYHEGAEVRKGTKYTLRTDAIYQKLDGQDPDQEPIFVSISTTYVILRITRQVHGTMSFWAMAKNEPRGFPGTSRPFRFAKLARLYDVAEVF